MRPILMLAPLLLVGCGAEPPAPSLGETVWNANCKVCHLNGMADAPRLGDKAAWAPRIAKGLDTLVQNATQGFSGSKGQMPARGGNASLSDADVQAAVSYMIDQSR